MAGRVAGAARRGALAAVTAASIAVLLPDHLAAQQRGMDVSLYVFRLTLPDTGGTIGGRTTVHFVRRRGTDTLRLDLVGMTVDSVKAAVNAGAIRLPYRHEDGVLRVALGPWAEGRDRTVAVWYHGVPADGLIYRVLRGRRSWFGDNWPERARYWLPTVDHPADKARVRWEIDAPGGWRVIANGQPLGTRPLAGGRIRHTFAAAPMPTYCMVLGATEMSVSRHRPARGGPSEVPVEVWTFPEDSVFADSIPFRRATEIVETMQRIVGPFPYERLAHVQSSTRYGGMENATAIFYPESAYVTRRLGEGTVRHETSHQWFGDAVTAPDWHHLWLSEGFASYFDGVIGAALDGDSVLARVMREDLAKYLASSVVDRPIVDPTVSDPNALLNTNVYEKGAWVLHMLRGEVGDSAFFRGVREYYRRYRDSTALSEDFQRVMERAAGRPLGWFFRQWLYQPGYPQLDIRWANDTTTNHVVLHVRQAQPAGWGRFRLRVPLRFVGVEGIAWRTLTLDPRYAEQVASFTVDRMPSDILVDPDGTLLMTVSTHR